MTGRIEGSTKMGTAKNENEDEGIEYVFRAGSPDLVFRAMGRVRKCRESKNKAMRRAG